MDVRRSLALLFTGFGLLVLPACAGATTYKFPVTTATLYFNPEDSWSAEDYGYPLGDYTFEVDPPALRVGEELRSADWMGYDSMMVFDLRNLYNVPEGALARLDLCLNSTTAAGRGFWTWLWLDHLVPRVSDFNWPGGGADSVFGFDLSGSQPGIIPYTFGDYYRIYHEGLESAAYLAIPLYLGDPGDGLRGAFEIAGNGNNLGLEAPYMLVTTVPEPSSLAALGAALLAFGGVTIGMRKKLLILPLALVALMLSACGIGLCASRALPDDFTYLPSFPRLWWSFGCGPTTGAMICGYYDNSGFPRMFRNPDGSDAVFPTDTYPNDNYIFLRRTATATS